MTGIGMPGHRLAWFEDETPDDEIVAPGDDLGAHERQVLLTARRDEG
jgi:hypothetical protein